MAFVSSDDPMFNQPTWVVQYGSDPRLRMALVALDIPWIPINIKPFERPTLVTFGRDGWPVNKNIIPYGRSPALTHIGLWRGWRGTFMNYKTFLMHEANRNRPSDMLNYRPFIGAIEYAKGIRWDRIDSRFHIRPNDDSKIFAGMILSGKELYDWLNLTAKTDQTIGEELGVLTSNTSIMISQEQELHAEWRWIIVDGKVIDGSQYRLHGQQHVAHTDVATSAMANVASAMAQGWLPHKTCVMDTAMTSKGHKIVEFNCFNGSGFYDHDIPKIVRSVTDSLLA